MSTFQVGVKPSEAKQVLPVEAYTSQEWFDREQKELFSRVWTFACTMDDVKNPGDYKTVQVGLYPMVIVHGHDGEVRAFHNICRHRGSQLLENGSGQIKRTMVCAYHRWAYNTDGTLRGVPQDKILFGEKGVSKCDHSLKVGAIGNYRNLLFINPQENPEETFADYLSNLPDNTWPAKTENLMTVARFNWTMKCNWKVFVENAQDGYHLMHLHKNTLGGPGVDGQRWRPLGRHWNWQGLNPIMSEEAIAEATKKMTTGQKVKASIASILGDWQPMEGTDLETYGGEVFGFFPTFLIQPLIDNVGFAKLTPVSPTETLFEGWVMMAPFKNEKERKARLKTLLSFAPMPEVEFDENGLANGGKPITLEEFPVHPLESGNFHAEDVWQVEMVQNAMASPAFEVGPLSNGEGETALTYFQQNILDYVPVKKSQSS